MSPSPVRPQSPRGGLPRDRREPPLRAREHQRPRSLPEREGAGGRARLLHAGRARGPGRPQGHRARRRVPHARQDDAALLRPGHEERSPPEPREGEPGRDERPRRCGRPGGSRWTTAPSKGCCTSTRWGSCTSPRRAPPTAASATARSSSAARRSSARTGRWPRRAWHSSPTSSDTSARTTLRWSEERRPPSRRPGREKLREILLSGGDPMMLLQHQARGLARSPGRVRDRVDPDRHQGDGLLPRSFRRRVPVDARPLPRDVAGRGTAPDGPLQPPRRVPPQGRGGGLRRGDERGASVAPEYQGAPWRESSLAVGSASRTRRPSSSTSTTTRTRSASCSGP